MKFRAIIKSIRGPFLILTPICVFLGVSTVVASQISVDFQLLLLILLGAVLAHVSVNTLNEYFDFKSGLDLTTIKTRFSGGSGALPENPDMANAVLTIGLVSLLATSLIGLFFAWKIGLGIIPIGVVGLLLILTYTGWINKQPVICLLAPGIGFGLLMVVGTQFVLAGKYLPLSWLAGLIPFFLVNNLLLINQYPDIQADTGVGRNNLVITHGIIISNRVYAAFVIATIAVITTCVFTGKFPVSSLIALIPIPLAFFTLSGAMKYGENIGSYPQYLAANVIVAIVIPTLLGLSIIIG